MTLRVLLVGPVPPPNGGMALQTLQLYERLREEGLQVTLCPVNPPYRPAWVGKLPVLRALARLLPYFLALRRELRRHDVVHLMANSGWAWHLFAAPVLWLAHRCGTPVIVNYRGGLADEFFARSFSTVQKTLRYAACVIVPTGFLQEVFARYGVHADIVPNIVDLQQFTPGPVPLRERTPHIVVTRNLEALYDNATALRAFALFKKEFPDAKLTLAGEGPEREMLITLAHELGVADAVHFAGRLPREAVAQLLHTATAVCNPSLADNSPNSLIEAMAAGVPIVSTKVGGVPYLVADGEQALLVNAGDPVQLAEALSRMHQAQSLADQLAGAGHERAQNFTWAAVRRVLLPLYAKHADRRRVGHA